MNQFFIVFAVVLSVVWISTIFDWAFSLGWGWDMQIIWAAPPMMLFAVFVRFCCIVVFKFVGDNFSGS